MITVIKEYDYSDKKFMNQFEQEIKHVIKNLLSNKKVDILIAYEKGTLPLRTTPCFIMVEDDINKIVWNSFCSNNLAVYLPRIIPKQKEKKLHRVGIISKGCDSRSVAGLIKEKQINRDEIFILGVACSGMINFRKIFSEVEGKEIIAAHEDDENIIVDLIDRKKILKKTEYLYESCINCAYPIPKIYDALISEAPPALRQISSDVAIKEFSAKTREERWRIFETELSKCIRCYACRNACPNCYCKECFAEQTKPKWLGITNDLTEIIFYHIGRIFHQAGRCVDCGACVRACPMDINLRLFARILVDEVKERFGYEPGLSLEELPALAAYAPNDSQEFITEP